MLMQTHWGDSVLVACVRGGCGTVAQERAAVTPSGQCRRSACFAGDVDAATERRD